MKIEKEKMVSGEPYDAFCKELTDIRTKVIHILQLADYHTITAMQLIEKVPEGRYYGRILFKANLSPIGATLRQTFI